MPLLFLATLPSLHNIRYRTLECDHQTTPAHSLHHHKPRNSRFFHNKTQLPLSADPQVANYREAVSPHSWL